MFLDDLGTSFRDVGSTIWGATTTVVNDVYGGIKSLANRSVNAAERTLDKGLNAADALTELIKSPIVIVGGIALVLLLMSK